MEERNLDARCKVGLQDIDQPQGPARKMADAQGSAMTTAGGAKLNILKSASISCSSNPYLQNLFIGSMNKVLASVQALFRIDKVVVRTVAKTYKSRVTRVSN